MQISVLGEVRAADIADEVFVSIMEHQLVLCLKHGTACGTVAVLHHKMHDQGVGVFEILLVVAFMAQIVTFRLRNVRL